MNETATLLHDKYNFSEEIASHVGEVASRQRIDFDSYQDFLAHMGADNLSVVRYDGYKSAQVVDIRPRRDHDEKHALVVHVAMANALDPNQLYQIATIANANPDRRVIAMGNPSAPFIAKSRVLTHAQRKQVAHGDFSPSVDPLLKYLEEAGITSVDHYGYSYGEVTATDAINRGNQEVKAGLVLDPATTANWISRYRIVGAAKLGIAFMSTGSGLSESMLESGSQAFIRACDDSAGQIGYSLGVARLSNIATALGLSHGGFAGRTSAALTVQPNARHTIAWAENSEFNVSDSTKNAAESLADEFGEQIRLRLVAGRHAVANSIFFQAALVKEALSVA